jgi:hypothetical protein
MKILPESFDSLGKKVPQALLKEMPKESEQTPAFYSDFKEASDKPSHRMEEIDTNTYRKKEENDPKPTIMVRGGEAWIQFPSLPVFQPKAIASAPPIVITAVHYATQSPLPTILFKTDALPLEIKIEKVEGKLHITLYSSDELRKELQHLIPALNHAVAEKIQQPFRLELSDSSSHSNQDQHKKRQQYVPQNDDEDDNDISEIGHD